MALRDPAQSAASDSAGWTKARSLYAKHGYHEIPRYSNDPLAHHCFEKTLNP